MNRYSQATVKRATGRETRILKANEDEENQKKHTGTLARARSRTSRSISRTSRRSSRTSFKKVLVGLNVVLRTSLLRLLIKDPHLKAFKSL